MYTASVRRALGDRVPVPPIPDRAKSIVLTFSAVANFWVQNTADAASILNNPSGVKIIHTYLKSDFTAKKIDYIEDKI
jgi:hypothetical protein